MTFKRSKRLRMVSVFLLSEIIFNILFPTVSWALTAGPTAPEATSFEPVDTTDLVDLKTGDFTYNVPLLEVPGPAGGYPLAMSYHAGIQPDQEASWTGLGWTLNPGSIFRLVNGYPDDHNAVTNVVRDYWSGGVTTTKSIGLSVGVANVATVSAGLVFANDTYRGRGVGGYIGAGTGTNNTGLNANANIGLQFSPYGGMTASMGVGLGIGATTDAVSVSAGVGFSINTDLDAGVSGQVSASSIDKVKMADNRTLIIPRSPSLTAAEISSDNSGSTTLGIGGYASSVYNNTAGHMSTNSKGESIDIPIYIGINLRLGRSYTRYWIDEENTALIFGSLYLGDVAPAASNAFDTYDMTDISIDSKKNTDAEKVLGGSFPDVDVYTVMAQGVSGNIQPYNFRQYLYRQDKVLPSSIAASKSYPLSSDPPRKAVEYRFVNDFSNRFEYEPGDFTVGTNDLTFDFSDDPLQLKTGRSGSELYNIAKNHLAGSKHIEWYSNSEILLTDPEVDPYDEGFVNYVADDFVRDNNSQVGGFMVTNSTGVNYHFALPAYSFGETTTSYNTATEADEEGVKFNVLRRPARYAYTWFLTAVTGPDYVDRNGNHIADHGDWGYWVNFDYKKWDGNYQWRNPGQGKIKDIDNEFETYSYGSKEVYYLDKITTETHVAVFETSERWDGREVSDITLGTFLVTPIFEECDDGGRQECLDQCDDQFCDQGNCAEPEFSNCRAGCPPPVQCPIIGYNFPKPSKKLDEIRLFNYDDFEAERTDDEYLIRSIVLDYSYSLAPGTPNSINPVTHNNEGKLTLESIQFRGKKGISLIPPTQFSYLNAPYGGNKRDMWGFYKSDFSEEFKDQTNEIIGRQTTTASSADVDAWSMNQIETPLGAVVNIEYESDKYVTSVLSPPTFLRVKEVTETPTPGQLKIKLWEQIDLEEYFDEDDVIKLDVLGTYQVSGGGPSSTFSECSEPGAIFNINGHRSIKFGDEAEIESIDVTAPSPLDHFIIVNAADLYDELKNQTKTIEVFANFPCDTELDTYKFNLTYSGAKAWPKFITAGVISIDRGEQYGGGIRVKSVSISQTNNSKRTTKYEYSNGTTSYEPYEILSPKLSEAYVSEVDVPLNADGPDDILRVKNDYKSMILDKIGQRMNIARAMPGPGVIYGSVTMREENVTSDEETHALPNYSIYEFQTFDESMIQLDYGDVTEESLSGSYGGVDFDKAYHRSVSLKDFSTSIGVLKSVTVYNNINDQPVSKTINHFLNDDLLNFEDNLEDDFSNIGLVEEAYTRARIMYYDALEEDPYPGSGEEIIQSPHHRLLGVISKRETYPLVPTGQTNINYKTDIESATENIEFDFLSGEPTKIVTTDGYGQRSMSMSVPAYKRYNVMGSKVDDIGNKNMLTQPGEQYSFLVDATNTPTGLLSAGVQTWSDQVPVVNLTEPQSGIWRAQSSYLWAGGQALNTNGSYPIADFNSHTFSYTPASANDGWEKQSEVTLFDPLSHALEGMDINSNFAATRMTNDFRKIVATSTNSRYGEMASSGAEFYINSTTDGGVVRGEGIASAAQAHTGRYSLLIGVNKTGFNYTLSPSFADLTKKYHASVWVYAPGDAESQNDLDKIELYFTINNVKKGSVHPVVQKSKSKSWHLLNLDITPEGNDDVFISVKNGTSRGIYFDDFRVHPLNGSLTSYVYDGFSGELTHILDHNNLYTKFEYDAVGRLVRSSKELLNFDFGNGKESFRADLILNENKYNYGKNN